MKTQEHKELWIPYKYAEIREIKHPETNNQNGLRIYCTQYPESFRVQIRTFAPINEYGRGKPRNMKANITLSRKQLHEICDYVDNYSV